MREFPFVVFYLRLIFFGETLIESVLVVCLTRHSRLDVDFFDIIACKEAEKCLVENARDLRYFGKLRRYQIE